MTLLDELHGSKAHADYFDANCPKCVRDRGLDGILDHLTRCAQQNERDWELEQDPDARAVAAEQRRMIGVLKLYKKWCKPHAR